MRSLWLCCFWSFIYSHTVWIVRFISGGDIKCVAFILGTGKTAKGNPQSIELNTDERSSFSIQSTNKIISTIDEFIEIELIAFRE